MIILLISDRNLVFLMINTNYFSIRAFKNNPKVTEIADMQIHWLDEQLSLAKKLGQSVILAGHIPPG